MNVDLNKCKEVGNSLGKDRKNCSSIPESLINEIPSNHHNLCASVFEISCHNSHEEFECNEGVEHAKMIGNCKDHKTHSFKVNLLKT